MVTKAKVNAADFNKTPWSDVKTWLDDLNAKSKLVSEAIARYGTSISGWATQEMAYLPNLIADNERLIGVLSGSYNGLTALIALTEKRIIFLDKKIFGGAKTEEFALNKISSVQMDSGFVFGEIKIIASGNNAKIKVLDKVAAQKFVADVRQAIEGAETKRSAPASDSMAEQLTKLASLLNKGLLTEDEFMEQKRRLLQ